MTNDILPVMPEPAAWANADNLVSAKLGREQYGTAGACELHTWREGGPTTVHSVPLYTEDQVRHLLAEDRKKLVG